MKQNGNRRTVAGDVAAFKLSLGPQISQCTQIIELQWSTYCCGKTRNQSFSYLV